MLAEFEAIVQDLRPELISLSNALYQKPELSGAEYESAQHHMDLLGEHGFAVRKLSFPEFDTAFEALCRAGTGGPKIGFFCEYDALPEIGHGCGHNLLGAASTGAAIALARWLKGRELSAEVYVYGTPAEETVGGKIPMVEAGVFSSLDFALMAHPSNENRSSGTSRVCIALEAEYFGKESHAAAAPELGVNALNAVTLLFTGINFNREHWPRDVQVHGCIAQGGTKANIVPDYSRARFYVRADSIKQGEQVAQRVRDIAQGAALMTGARYRVNNFEYTIADMVTNPVLRQVCTDSMVEAGLTNIGPDTGFGGSLDIGNVSRLIPCVHPYFDITADPAIALHTREFAAATVTDYALDNMLRMCTALALTAAKAVAQPDLLRQIKEAQRARP